MRRLGNSAIFAVPAGGVVVASVSLALLIFATAIVLPTTAEAVNSCNGALQLNYVSPTPSFPDIGSLVKIELTIGAGTITGGTTLTVTAVRHDLACKQAGSLTSCAGVDADPGAGVGGPPLSYTGDASIGTTCAGTSFTSNNPGGGTSPNQLVFTPSPALVIPANNANFCTLTFTGTVNNRANNGFDINTIIELSGFNQTSTSTGDAVCNTTPALSAGAQASGSLSLCPACAAPQVCEQVLTCNTETGQCQPSFKAPTTICRGSSGVCDVAESCTGTSSTCPADAFAASTTICRASGGVCDVSESCTGTTAACPTDTFVSATTICRASGGVCDVAESCTGTSAACPGDSFAAATTICRASGGVCDVAESCTGTSAACPGDNFAAPTTTCRAAVDVCDVSESCTGTSSECPEDGFVSPTTTCRESANACDPAESCTGTSASCPPNDLGDQTACEPPKAIPTLGEWGMLGFVGLLVGMAVFTLRKRSGFGSASS